jgi:hypothetical protein
MDQGHVDAAVARLCDAAPAAAGGEAVVVPLLDQLADAIASSGESGDGLRSYAHSQPPIDLGAFELWRTVDAGVRDWAASCDVDAGAVCAGLDRVAALRALLAAVAARVAGKGTAALARCCADLEAWSDRIETLLNPSRTVRRIWGAECPHCEQSMTSAWVDEQKLRVPAIALVPEGEGRAAALVCGHCGWVRRVPVAGGAGLRRSHGGPVPAGHTTWPVSVVGFVVAAPFGFELSGNLPCNEFEQAALGGFQHRQPLACAERVLVESRVDGGGVRGHITEDQLQAEHEDDGHDGARC